MEIIAELLFLMFHAIADLRPKQALALLILIVGGFFGLYRYGCMSLNTKQSNQFNEIVATAVANNYVATTVEVERILSDNKVTRMELSELKSVFKRDLKLESKT